MIESTQLGFIVIGLLGWGSLFFVIFNKRKENLVSIPLLPQIGLYLLSLVPLGLIVGLYIEMRTKKIEGVKRHKYSVNARKNATLIIAISIASCILSAYNLTQN